MLFTWPRQPIAVRAPPRPAPGVTPARLVRSGRLYWFMTLVVGMRSDNRRLAQPPDACVGSSRCKVVAPCSLPHTQPRYAVRRPVIVALQSLLATSLALRRGGIRSRWCVGTRWCGKSVARDRRPSSTCYHIFYVVLLFPTNTTDAYRYMIIVLYPYKSRNPGEAPATRYSEPLWKCRSRRRRHPSCAPQ